ncbi:MAG: hypothetical protein GY952_14820 [Rhodobacteraceae bacterium]|nr:hypothetical protein [Paracoccaceae bacterium]
MTDRKIAAKATLINIELKNSKKGTIADPDEEEAEREKAGREVEAINDELDLIDAEVESTEFEPEWSTDAGLKGDSLLDEIGELDDEGGLFPDSPDADLDDSHIICPPCLGEDCDGIDNDCDGRASEEDGNSFNPRIGIGIGIFDGPALTFTNFSQRPTDENGMAIFLEGSYPISYSGSSLGWEIAVGLELLYASQEYNGHINLPGGAPGPSAGDIRYIFGGGSIQFENRISDNFTFGVEPGIGLLDLRLDGSFVADGTVPAATLDIYGMWHAGPNFYVGAGVSAIKPLGDFNGGVPGGVRFPVTAGTGKMYWLKGQYKF